MRKKIKRRSTIKNEKGYISIENPEMGPFGEKISRLKEKFFPRHLQDWRRIATWLVVFIAGTYLVWGIASKTAGEIASLSLSPTSATVTAGNDFNVNIKVDTKNNNVVAVKSIVEYNPNDFELVDWSTDYSAFYSGNTCVFNGKPCEIITNEPQSGRLTITLAKPTPGVNTSDGQIASLLLRAKKALTPSSDNITLRYVAFNNYTDSDVIFDDGEGTDILSQVTNTRITANLPAPTGLAAVPQSATLINLSWNAPQASFGITGYKIFRNGTQIGTSTTNSYSDSGLSPLTAYQYRVSSYDGSSHESPLTSQVLSTTLADTEKPSKPGGLQAVFVGMDALEISWNESTDNVGVTEYIIYRDGVEIMGVAPSYHTNVYVGDLSPETEYVFAVSARDAVMNESDRSDSITVETAADSEAPSVPSNVNAQAVSMNQINLSWSASADNVGVTGYNIYRNGSKIGTSTTTSYNDTGLSPSTTYSYEVSAYDAKDNESDKSSPVSAATNSDNQAPSVPGNLSGTPTSMTQINLSWSASTDNVGVTGYRIFRNGTQIGTSATTSYQDTGLTKSTAYSYTVLAYDAAGNISAQTTPVSVTTLSDSQAPTVPSGLSGTAVSMTQINLSWNASTDNIGVVGYRLYRNGSRIAEQSETTFSDNGLTAGTQYSYTVSAYDADGNESAQSAPVSVTTLTRKYTISDFAGLVADWLQTKVSPADVSGDGTVNSKDLGIMMSNWENSLGEE